MLTNNLIMKKGLLLLAVFTFYSGFAQKIVSQKIAELVAKNTHFVHYSVLNPVETVPNKNISKVVTKATFAKINTIDLADLVNKKHQNIEVEIPYQGQNIFVQLYKVNLFSEGFHVDTDQTKSTLYEPGVYYRGIVKGNPNSIASFNFFNGELNGVISSDILANLVVGKVAQKNKSPEYIIYSDSDMKVKNNFDCHVKDVVNSVTTPDSRNSVSTQSLRCVTMYFEIDNNLYVENGSNVVTTTNWMTSVFNNVQTIYNNDAITVSLKSLFIWTLQDPYEGIGASSSDYLYKFNEVRPVFDGDVGQLLGIDPGGLGGVAVTINGLCNQNNFSYSDVSLSYETVPTYSWTINVITHEFGHLLGSRHTHGCYWNGDNTAIDGCGQSAGYTEGTCVQGPIPSIANKGTIMSYCHLISGVGINLNNGFGPQPAAAIIAAINSGSCLSSDCINTCINTISGINIINTSSTSANISWTDLGGSSTWQVAVSPFSSNVLNWVSVSTNSYSVSGLLPNTYYKVLVRPICGFGLTASNENTILLTSTNYCDGVLITDTGGVSNNYTDSETYIRTIIPNVANNKITVEFSAFDLELDYDYLHIYDGNSTAAPDLSSGGFTGTTLPGTFTSTANDGSLTLKFFSDSGVVAAGYIANVSCSPMLSSASFEPNIDFTYFPNPTNGIVTIASKTIMSEILVYNLEGRLLFQNKINGLDAKVNMTLFATGTYFFKIKFIEKEANFKVMRY